MNTKIIFNTDRKLKDAAMKKAQRQGLTLTAVLTMATQAFVDGEISVDIVARDIARGREQIRQGKTIAWKDAMKKLGLE